MSEPPDFPTDDLEGGDYLGRVDLDNEGVYSADIFSDLEIDPDDDFHFDFGALFMDINFDTHDQTNLLDILSTDLHDPFGEERIDIGGEDVRGGYDRDEVIDFLNHTGFWGLGIVYYDESLDEYFVDLQDVSG